MSGFPGFRDREPSGRRVLSPRFFPRVEFIQTRKPGNPEQLGRLSGPPGQSPTAGVMAAIAVQVVALDFGSDRGLPWFRRFLND